jgi:uncharacterized protein YyaL (SSP411 family)
MTHPGGGFYSAEDADSEGHEGKFYCWTPVELAKLLGPEEYLVAAKYFGVTKAGNFVDHSHPEPLPGQNVLYVAQPEVPAGDAPLLASARAKMLAARAGRVRPHLDDKILASWNGLMLGAFARAGVVLNEERYRLAAERNLAFIRENLWDAKSQALSHRWRDGERDQVQLLEGYAFLLDGVIQLYEATLEPGHLDFAGELAGAMLARFYDPAGGGFWQSPAGAGDLILRVKDDYDGAEPSGNAMATLALLKLAAITGHADFEQAAEATLRLAAARGDAPAAARRMQVFAGCCMRRTRCISRTRSCWGIRARWNYLRRRCPPTARPRLMFAAGTPASRPPAIRRRCGNCYGRGPHNRVTRVERDRRAAFTPLQRATSGRLAFHEPLVFGC